MFLERCGISKLKCDFIQIICNIFLNILHNFVHYSFMQIQANYRNLKLLYNNSILQRNLIYLIIYIYIFFVIFDLKCFICLSIPNLVCQVFYILDIVILKNTIFKTQLHTVNIKKIYKNVPFSY